jgi:dUTP pyrophosphatase
MKVKFKRFDKTLPAPLYKTEGAVCIDLFCREEVTILPNSLGYIPQNIAIELPKNHWGMLVARSSMHKRGLIVANGVGVGDDDFCGDNDEYILIVYNLTNKPVIVEKGARIAQLGIIPYTRVELVESDKLNGKDRRGIGSTGK